MIILVEDRLGSVLYANGKKPEKKDRLVTELNKSVSCWTTALPTHWNYEIKVEETIAIIHVFGVEPPFCVEGYDYLYFVTSKEHAKCVSKATLFSKAIQASILDDIIECAQNSGYDISNEDLCKQRLIASATMVLKSVPNVEQSVPDILRIPYPLGIDIMKMAKGSDFSELPEYYEINKDNSAIIKSEVSKTIQSEFNLVGNEVPVPTYSENWFISA